MNKIFFVITICGGLAGATNVRAQCVPSLGRTFERLPNTDINSFIQQEVPHNTALAVCAYAVGGVVVNYPVDWFTEEPRVLVTLQPTIPDPAIEYFSEIIQNSEGSSTVRVLKYDTTDLCGTSSCIGGQCPNAAFCSGGTCEVTVPSADPCLSSASCNGVECVNTCQTCAGSQCASGAVPGNGEICNGFCNNFGFGPDNCQGSATLPTGGTCEGFCLACTGSCDMVPAMGTQCRGLCTACTSRCDGEYVGSYFTCSGTASSCDGTCNGSGVCASCSSGNGFGACAGSFSGVCTGTSTQCNGICSSCTGVCSVGGPIGSECRGTCTVCTGSCYGTGPVCTGQLTGGCGTSNGMWTGICSSCASTCTGTGTSTGNVCITSCSDSQAVEAGAGEVTVNIYAIQ